jgi:hypothetical protein
MDYTYVDVLYNIDIYQVHTYTSVIQDGHESERCIYIYIYIYIHTSTYAYLDKKNTNFESWKPIFIQVPVFMCVCVREFMLGMHGLQHVYIAIYIYIYIYIYIQVPVFMCMCLCMFTAMWRVSLFSCTYRNIHEYVNTWFSCT